MTSFDGVIITCNGKRYMFRKGQTGIQILFQPLTNFVNSTRVYNFSELYSIFENWE